MNIEDVNSIGNVEKKEEIQNKERGINATHVSTKRQSKKKQAVNLKAYT